MITKDSYEKLGDKLYQVLESSLQVPYSSIILVDDSSSLKTRESIINFAKKYNKDIIIERSRLPPNWSKPTRAIARQTAINIFFERFSNEWLMFLDDDVMLNAGWWEEASRYTTNPKVGLIWGIDYTPLWKDRITYLARRGISVKEYAISQFRKRGGLHDTLLRRDAIKNLHIPPFLHVYEDLWVKLHVECNNWSIAIVETGATHLRTSGEGYSEDDVRLMEKINALFGLEPVGVFQVLKALIGLPAYIYATANVKKGFDMWSHRISARLRMFYYRLKIGKIDPCAAIRGEVDLAHLLKV